MRLICERCAAVAVDYQERLLPPIRGRERLMKKSAELLEGLSLLSVPVLFTEQYPQGLGKTDPALLALAPGAPVIEKTSFGAADTPVFSAALRPLGRDQIILFVISKIDLLKQIIFNLFILRNSFFWHNHPSSF